VKDLTDEQVLEQQISENLQREDLTPLDWSVAYRAAVDLQKQKSGTGPGAEKGAVAVVAARYGLSTSVVYQTLQLAKLIPAAADALRADLMTKNHAIDCARLEPADQQRYLDEMADYEKYEADSASVRIMRDWIDSEVHHDVQAARFPAEDLTLYPPAGACSACPKLVYNNRELFADIKNGSTCTDPQCYERKTEAFSKRSSRSEKKQAAQQPSLIEHDRQPEERSLFEDPDDQPDFDERKPAKKAAAKKSVSDETKYNKAREIEKLARAEILRQVLNASFAAAKKQKKLLTTEDLREVALYTFRRVPGDNQIALAKTLGWERTQRGYGRGVYDNPTYERTAEIEIPKMKRPQLAMLLLACCYAQDLTIPGYYIGVKLSTHTGKLGEACKRYKIDQDAVRRARKLGTTTEHLAAAEKPAKRELTPAELASLPVAKKAPAKKKGGRR
jgi:hypothetical protein